MSVQPRTHLSFEDWLEAERGSLAERSQYIRGEVFAMAGGSREHNLITTNIIRELGIQFKKTPCCVYSGDLKVRIQAAEVGAYPDVMAVCGEHQYLDDRRDIVTNPVLIIEVLSDSTEAHDRGDKFADYRRLPSLRTYVLAAQDRARIELYERQADDGWLLKVFEGLSATVPLASVDATLALAEVYDKVDLPAPAHAGQPK